MSDKQFRALSSAAVDALGQLFVHGPTWDGDIISKTGRDDLIELGLASRAEGWAFITEKGLRLAISVEVKGRHDQRWYRKQQCL